MSGWQWHFPKYPEARPRAADGHRARSQRGAIGETWWSRRFVEALEALALGSRLTRGRSYARSGQVIELVVEPGTVRARVQGTRKRPYEVRLAVRPLTEEEWARVADTLAGEALHAAELLAGELPHELEEVFTRANLSLFPAGAGDLEMDCSCPDFASPCKHAAASLYILAEAFDLDPFLILALRGWPRERLLNELQARQVEELRLAAEALDHHPADPSSDDDASASQGSSTPAPPLPIDPRAFWRAAGHGHAPAGTAALPLDPRAPEHPDAMLQELGPPPAGGPPAAALTAALGAAYRAMAPAAERLARGEMPPPTSSPGTASTRTGASTRTSGGGGSNSGAARPRPRRSRPARASARTAPIVLAATSHAPGQEVHTAVACTRRRKGSACPGRLYVFLESEEANIQWRCPTCGGAGTVTDWACTEWDLGGPGALDEAAEERLLWIIAAPSYDAIRALTFQDLAVEQAVRGARTVAGGIMLEASKLTMGQLEDALAEP
ncbi:MAG: SWIM zinc finger family protein [Gemmatimonadota bacterium]